MPTAAYTPVAKAFHWIMALMWIGVFALGKLSADGPDWLNPNHVLTAWHKGIAATILALVFFRLAWRLTHPAPALPETMSALMKKAAHAGHVLLYVLALIALPLSGWYFSSVAGRPVYLAGLFELPAIAGADQAFRATAREIHENLAFICLLLVLGHIAVALKHHFVDRDDILSRMSFFGR